VIARQMARSVAETLELVAAPLGAGVAPGEFRRPKPLEEAVAAHSVAPRQGEGH